MGSKKIKKQNILFVKHLSDKYFGKKLKYLIKNVPYYSQRLDVCVIDKNNKIYKNIIDGYWFKRSCGIVSLKMVMDYYGKFLAGYKREPVMKLIWEGMKLDAFSESAGGWYHKKLINLAEKYGFLGKFFDWNDKKNKSTGRQKNKKIEKQKEKGISIIKNILKKQKPIIVSVYKNFNPKNSGHLIVLAGYKNNIFGDLEGFYFNDPDGYDRKSKKYAFVDKNKFLNGWRGRAILIFPKFINKK